MAGANRRRCKPAFPAFHWRHRNRVRRRAESGGRCRPPSCTDRHRSGPRNPATRYSEREAARRTAQPETTRADYRPRSRLDAVSLTRRCPARKAHRRVTSKSALGRETTARISVGHLRRRLPAAQPADHGSSHPTIYPRPCAPSPRRRRRPHASA